VLNGTNVTVYGSNAGATREPGEPYHDGFYGGKSVWWSWTAPSSGTVTLAANTSTVQYPILAVYTGTQLSTLSSVAGTRGNSYYALVSFSAVSGLTYQIALDDYWGYGGNYTLTLSR